MPAHLAALPANPLNGLSHLEARQAGPMRLMQLPRRILDGPWRLRAALRGNLQVGPRSTLNAFGLNVPKGATLTVGADCILNCRFSYDAPTGKIRIGDRTFIGKSHLVCHSSIEIGNDVLISWGATIVDHNSHAIAWDARKDDVLNWAKGVKDWTHVARAPVVIEDKAWIGFGATILKGVTVGEGAVVGAGAIVTKDVPPYTAVVGNPARVVKSLQVTGE
jgi:galactoside O-acetyltransferase